jgi:hypothetical protein
MRSVLSAALMLAGVLSLMGAGAGQAAAGDCCQPACCQPAPCCKPVKVCCPPPPPPVEVKWCLVDPCTGCSYEVSACLPACCAGQIPCLESTKPGLLGRKVFTYKFDCGECVDVVLTKHGRTIVRD